MGKLPRQFPRATAEASWDYGEYLIDGNEYCMEFTKLDGVGPVDIRPSTD